MMSTPRMQYATDRTDAQWQRIEPLLLSTAGLMRSLLLFLLLMVGWYGVSHGDHDVEADSFVIDPKGFVPLEVGNRWTYEHKYINNAYGHWEPGDEADPEWAAYLKQFEVPGYPIGESSPPRSLTEITYRDSLILTIEITHTEWIDEFEYFVLSEVPYDWPPLPTFFWAGYKVRWSDDDVLLVRGNDADIPLYDFSLQREGIERSHWESSEWYYYGVSVFEYNPIDTKRWMIDLLTYPDYSEYVVIDPASRGQILQASFSFSYSILCNHCIWRVPFVQGYGIGHVQKVHLGISNKPLFANSLWPISAIISGNEISYGQATGQAAPTVVRERSWGAVKREFMPMK